MNSNEKKSSLALALVMAIVLAGSAMAEVVPVSNPSFEDPPLDDGAFTMPASSTRNIGGLKVADPIPGWRVLSGGVTGMAGEAGVWHPQSGQSVDALLSGLDGSQIAYSNGANIRQDLSATIEFGRVYTMKINVGGRDASAYINEPYGVFLYGCDYGDCTGTRTELAKVNDKNETGWVEQTLTYQPDDNSTDGKRLSISLFVTGDNSAATADDGSQVNFDNVRLTSARLVSCEGFFSPFAESLILSAKNKRAIPVKMRLYDYFGNELTNADFTVPPVVNVSYVAEASGAGVEADLVSSGLADEGNAFRYDPIEGQWIINLAAKMYSSPGTYTVSVALADPEFVVPEGGLCSQDFIRQ